MDLDFNQQRLLIAIEHIAIQVRKAIDDDRIIDVITESHPDGTVEYTIVVGKP